MALQNASILSMVGLGTLQDFPLNPLQPKLVDAVHLRWAFPPERGFPWHGFYLFRRDSRDNRESLCFHHFAEGFEPGPMNVTRWNSGLGTISSDQPLMLLNDFPLAQQVEFDLAFREYLEFEPSELARIVDINIGFRKILEDAARCLHFANKQPAVVQNPYSDQEVSLETLDQNRISTAENQIVQIEAEGALASAFVLGSLSIVKIEKDIRIMEVTVVGPEKVVIRANDGDGNEIEGKLISDPQESPLQVYRLEGEGIQDTLITSETETYLLSICFEGRELGNLIEIPATAYQKGIEVARVVVSGKGGDVVPASLRADAIDKVIISSGSASLVDLCWTAVSQDAQRGWKPVVDIPITLPVRHPDYPACGSVPTNFPESRTEALSRVRYGNPLIWEIPFEDIHEQCLNLVRGGPSIPMADPDRSVNFRVTPEPGDPATQPKIPRHHPLQLLLLAAMHAPIAQILGLYWSDTNAVPGETYDYLIVADHEGTAGHNVGKILNQIGAEGFTNLNGYIVFEKRVEKAEPLEPPVDTRGYALPSVTRPDASGQIVDAPCSLGLRWHLPAVNNLLLPNSPVLYHLWRVDYGRNEPLNPAGDTKFDPLTKENPLLVVENMLSISGVQRPPDWPPFPLYGFDTPVSEGWYGYRVSNIDIFGRHSKLGPDARWFEWTPVPSLRPWYYVDPPGNTAIHPFAVALLDKLPPPPPTGTEAYALDPKDPFVQRDAAYNTWFATLSSTEQLSLIGLRVSWLWTEAHMRQAPDTKEFRIYYQGGRLNTILSRTTDVTAANATESFVQTGIHTLHPAGTYIGCSLKMGPHIYSIVGSDAGTPLRLRVRNIGPLKDKSPAIGANCEINLPNNHSLFVNYGAAHFWRIVFMWSISTTTLLYRPTRLDGLCVDTRCLSRQPVTHSGAGSRFTPI